MKTWENQLICLYLEVCDEYRTHLCTIAQRMTNNQTLVFSDQEALTLYLFGLLQGRAKVSDIYQYAKDHLIEWFPTLPSYAALNKRINDLNPCFSALAERFLQRGLKVVETDVLLIDSLPIILAQAPRSSTARSCSEIANKGFLASKKQFYYGVKLHMVSQRRCGALPLPMACCLTPASTHDLDGLRILQPLLPQADLYADRAYCSEPIKADIHQENNIVLLTPHKKKPKGSTLDYLQSLYNTSISRVRQPIESLFSWLIARFNIQNGSTIRSLNGLYRHTFARIAAAAFALVYP